MYKMISLEIVKNYENEIQKSLNKFANVAEGSFKEFKTTKTIIDELKSVGIEDIVDLKTGCFGNLNFHKDKWIAIRADIDALPINSEKTQFKHLCGHHFHIVALLQAIKIIKIENIPLKYNLRFIFQPAEEIVNGAKFIIENGGLKDVSEIYGLHVEPELFCGEVFAEEGAVMAGARHFNITVKGKSTHAAYPHLGSDVIAASSNLIVSAQNIVSRMTSPAKSAVISFSTINGGSAHNILPEKVDILGTYRFLEESVDANIQKNLTSLLKSIDKFFKTKSKIAIDSGTSPVINDKYLVEKLKNVFKDDIFKFVGTMDTSMGAEDFCFYSKKVPSVFIKFGIRENDRIVPLHNRDFSVTVKPLILATYFWIKLLTM